MNESLRTDVLPHCTCHRCRGARAPDVPQRDASADTAPKSLPTQCQPDTGEASQRSIVALRSPDSTVPPSLCCEYDDYDDARAIFYDGEAAAAAHYTTKNLTSKDFDVLTRKDGNFHGQRTGNTSRKYI